MKETQEVAFKQCSSCNAIAVVTSDHEVRWFYSMDDLMEEDEALWDRYTQQLEEGDDIVLDKCDSHSGGYTDEDYDEYEQY